MRSLSVCRAANDRDTSEECSVFTSAFENPDLTLSESSTCVHMFTWLLPRFNNISTQAFRAQIRRAEPDKQGVACFIPLTTFL